MKHSFKIKRIIQKIAIILAVILALPQTPMAQRLGLGYTEAHADPLNSWIYLTTKMYGETLIIKPGFGVEEPVPGGTITYEYLIVDSFDYETDYLTYQFNTLKKNVQSGETDKIPVNEAYEFSFSDYVGKTLLLRFSYSGDDIYDTYSYSVNPSYNYSIIRLVLPEISQVKDVTRSENNYTLEFSTKNILNPELRNEYYYLLTPYDPDGCYDDLTVAGLVDRVLGDYEENEENTIYSGIGELSWEEPYMDETEESYTQTVTLEMDGTGLDEGFYVFHIVTADDIESDSVKYSKKVVTDVFHTPLKFTSADLEASCADNLVYQEEDITPEVTLTVKEGEGIRHDTAVAWLSDTDNQITFSFKKTTETDAVTGSAIKCSGLFDIYASSTYDGNSIATESLGTVYVGELEAPDIEILSDIEKNDDGYTFSIKLNNTEEEVTCYALLGEYNTTISEKDLIKESNIAPCEQIDGAFEFYYNGSDFAPGVYAFYVALVDESGNISNIVSTAPFITSLNLTTDDVSASAEDVVYTGEEQSPIVTLTYENASEAAQELINGKLSSAIENEEITFTFKRVKDADNNVISDEDESAFVKEAGTYEIYASSTAEDIVIISEELGTVDVVYDPKPVITGIADNTTYYADVEITVTDDNLSDVTLKKDSGTPVDEEIIDFSYSTFIVTEPGTYEVTATDEYGNTVTCKFTIAQKTVPITSTDKNNTYVPNTTYDVSQMFVIPKDAGTATYSIVTGNDGGTGEGSIAENTSSLTITKAGTIKIKVNTEGSTYVAPTYSTAILTVAKAEGSASVTIDDVTYGTAINPVVSSTTNTGVDYTIVYAGRGTTQYASSSTVPVKAGSYTATVTYPENDLYKETVENKDFNIVPATLTITAEAKSKKVGEADPTLIYNATGFQYNDNEEIVLTGSLTRENGETAGEYSITQGTLKANDNYAIAFTGATLTISPKDIVVNDNDDGKTHSHSWSEPEWIWNVSSDDNTVSLQAKFICSANSSEEHGETIDANLIKTQLYASVYKFFGTCVSPDKKEYRAYKLYDITTGKEVEELKHTEHTWQGPVWNWSFDTSKYKADLKAIFTCSVDPDEVHSISQNVPLTEIKIADTLVMYTGNIIGPNQAKYTTSKVYDINTGKEIDLSTITWTVEFTWNTTSNAEKTETVADTTGAEKTETTTIANDIDIVKATAVATGKDKAGKEYKTNVAVTMSKVDGEGAVTWIATAEDPASKVWYDYKIYDKESGQEISDNKANWSTPTWSWTVTKSTVSAQASFSKKLSFEKIDSSTNTNADANTNKKEIKEVVAKYTLDATVELYKTSSDKKTDTFKATVYSSDGKKVYNDFHTRTIDDNGTVTDSKIPADGMGLEIQIVGEDDMPKNDKGQVVFYYTGTTIKPAIRVYDWDSDSYLAEKTDYTVSYPAKSNKNVGTGLIVVKGKGNYDSKSQIQREFAIEYAPIDETTAVDLKGAKVKVSKDNFTYTGSELYPTAIELKLKGEKSFTKYTLDDSGKYVSGDKEIPATVGFINNINKGTAYVNLTGKGNSVVKGSFAIKAADISAAKVEAENGVWAVKGATPETMTVTFKANDDAEEITLIAGQDFKATYTYSDKKTKSGTAKIKLTGKGNFKSKNESATFEVEAFELSEVNAVEAYNKTKVKSMKLSVLDGQGVAIPKKYLKVTVINEETGAALGDKDKLATGMKVVVKVESANTFITGEAETDTISIAENFKKVKVTVAKGFTVTYTGTPIDLEALDPNPFDTSIVVKGLTLGEGYEVAGYTNNNKKGTMTVTLRALEGSGYSGLKTVKVKVVVKKLKKAD